MQRLFRRRDGGIKGSVAHPKRDRPTWVATGPLLPLCMGIAVLITAILNPGSVLLWVTAGLCFAAGGIVIALHFVWKRRLDQEAASRESAKEPSRADDG